MASLWQSRQRVRFCMYGGISLATFTWVGSYILWLRQGCMAFLPWVSDFTGGDSAVLFQYGMAIAAVLLLPTWFDYYFATKIDFAAYDIWSLMHAVMPLMGALCSASIVGVATNPWDKYLFTHMASAGGIFNGGVIFAIVVGLLDWHRGRPVKFMLAGACVLTTSLALLAFHTGKWFALEGGALTVNHGMSMMSNDFFSYCTGKPGSLHNSDSFNVAAFYEWILLGSLVGIAIVKMQEELHEWPAVGGDGAVDSPRMSETGRSESVLEGSTACTTEMLTDVVEHYSKLAASGKATGALERGDGQMLVTTATSAAMGCAAFGTLGGFFGLVNGCAIGFTFGVAPIVFTFGLSLPACVLIGGAVGLCGGSSAGGGVGAVGGGVLGYSTFRNWKVRSCMA